VIKPIWFTILWSNIFNQTTINLQLDGLFSDSPAVLIHGPRQCGKTTLARNVGDEKGYAYISFDDDVQRAAAYTDPVGYVADLPEFIVLDEVQRVPEIFTSLKMAIDKDRKPGRFILTGSANLLLLPTLADSLAGRIELLRLHPLSQAELHRSEPGFYRTICSAPDSMSDQQDIVMAKNWLSSSWQAATLQPLPVRLRVAGQSGIAIMPRLLYRGISAILPG